MTTSANRTPAAAGTLDGRVALVTGSSRGIGAAIASLLAAEGALVVVHGRDQGAIEQVRSAIEATGGTAIGCAADLTDFDEVVMLREAIERRLGPIDVLVANAGGNPVRPGPVEDLSLDGWEASLSLNLTATFNTVKAVLPGMKQRGRGTIVTVSSAASRRPTAMSPFAYAVAKAGVEVLTRTVALQAGPFGVRANCVAPETILTEHNQRRIPSDTQRAMIESHPIRRLGTPDDVAHAVLYLASDASSWVSGTVLDIAGGSVLA